MRSGLVDACASVRARLFLVALAAGLPFLMIALIEAHRDVGEALIAADATSIPEVRR